MDTDKSEEQRAKIKDRVRMRQRVLTRSLIFAFLIFATACTPIRPIVKVGLIAPFEGLYRQSGYAALENMRAAIGEADDGGFDLLPLALDGHADEERTRRSIAKLLADERVPALIGPLRPQMVAAVADLLAEGESTGHGFQWIVPYAVDPAGGFAHPLNSDAWALGLIEAVGTAVHEQGAARLLLSGDEDGWPARSDDEWSEIAGIAVDRVASPSDVGPDDAIFWMGDPANGAEFLNRLRSRQIDVPFWLGPGGDDPIFIQRADKIHGVHWATWTDLEYTSWAANRSLASPSTYLIYLATDTIVGSINGEETRSQPSGGRNWYVQVYAIDEDGVFIPRP